MRKKVAYKHSRGPDCLREMTARDARRLLKKWEKKGIYTPEKSPERLSGFQFTTGDWNKQERA